MFRPGTRGNFTKSSENEIIQKAMAAKDGSKLKALWHGDVGDYPSRSEADLALVSMLARLTGGDKEKIDTLFRKSGLMRKKWEREDYRDRTISRAIESGKVGYGKEAIVSLNNDLLKRIEAYKKVPKTAVENILKDKELLTQLALLAANDRGSYERHLMALKGAGVSSRDIDSFKRVVKSERGDLKTLTLELPLKSVRSFLPNAPVGEDIFIPRYYTITTSGVLKVGGTDKENKKVSPVPILIKRRLKNVVDGTEDVELTWLEDGKWRSLMVSREEISDSRLLLKLSGKGVHVNSITQRLMVEYLAEFMEQNSGFIPQARITNVLGWQGKKKEYGFFAGPKSLTSATKTRPGQAVIRFKGRDSGDDQIASGFVKKGNFERWSKVLPLIEDYPLVTLVSYASLAPVILPIVDAPNFIVDLASPTSAGKTTALMVAASFWGNPKIDQASSIIRSWDATDTWLGRAPNVLKNIPFFVDDTQRAIDRERVSRFIYGFSSGQGKGRGTRTGTQETGSWETVALSCGESKITTFCAAGGARARVLSLEGLPFKEKSRKMGLLVRTISGIVSKHYGHAGALFAGYVESHKPDWKKWRRLYSDYINMYQKDVVQSEVGLRQAEYLAVIHLTAVLAEDALGLNIRYDDHLKEVAKNISEGTEHADEATEARQLVIDMVLSKRNLFRRQNSDAPCPKGSWLGDMNPRGKKDCVAIKTNVLEEFLTKKGFDPRSILPTWKRRGLLNTDGEGKGFSRKASLGDGRQRAYFVKMDSDFLGRPETIGMLPGRRRIPLDK